MHAHEVKGEFLASFDRLRQIDVRPATAGRPRVVALALAGGLGAAIMVLLLLAQLAGQREPQVTSGKTFLAATLGAPQETASLVRKPVPGVDLRVDRAAARIRREGVTLELGLEGSSGVWTPHLRGATRPAPYGSEAVVFRGEYGLEHFVTVEKRQGLRTWRWELGAANLDPVLAADGGIDFFRNGGTATAGLRIEPVAVFDQARRNVTPKGARWQLARAGAGWTLALELDDSKLPVPYVIDPNISRTAVNTAVSNGGVTSIAPARPGNVGDILVAQVAVRSIAAIGAPAGWTAVGVQQDSGTGLRQGVFWATNSATLGTTFSWTGAVHAAASISAYADVHSTAPIDDSTENAGSGTVATALAVTTNFANGMVIPLYSVQGNSTAAQDAGQGVTEHVNTISTGNPANNRVRVAGADGLQATAGGSSDKTATTSNSAWVAHLVALRREPPDGLGTMAPDRADVAASSTGNTIVWTYTAPADGLVDGEVRLTVPASWSAPSTTTTAAGYTTSDAGTRTVSGQTIIVSGLTLASGATFQITYGNTASGGPGATASSTTGAVTWTTQQKGTLGGTLTDVAAQPVVRQNAPAGSGTASASRSFAAASSSGNTITFTYTAATGGMTNRTVEVVVPAGWTAPSTTGSNGGFTTADTGTVSVTAQTITVSGVTLAAGGTLAIVDGDTSGGGPGATATSTAGAQTWQGRATAGG